MKSFVLVALLSGVGSLQAFSVMENKNNQVTTTTADRRAFLSGAAAAAFVTVGASTIMNPSPASAEYRLGDPNSVVGREIRSFNALIKEFKNTALDGGLDASTLTEPSMPFIEFGEFLKNGQVAEVEFLAPSGEVAYVTLKGDKVPGAAGVTKTAGKAKKSAPPVMIGKYKAGVPIRIGQGYPTGKKGSWSSPDYVIRSVSNFRVPYKFTVPALKAYANASKK